MTCSRCEAEMELVEPGYWYCERCDREEEEDA